ncbi:AMP-binding protein [Emticicia agri]|uniref:AMP-dependent synthetase and ligase n=1 Tax=Emticicia agri TaxID=2492393 RepID=A0A4Q5M128_9BACT|nr:AMP-binding protein [Emticicia agri]RYU95882.1 AMP-dependent synthetase and ligase [Emticicia agri]
MQLDFQGPLDIQFRKFEEAWLDIPVFELFTKIVERKPDKIALICGENQLSYKEVYEWVLLIANELKIQHSKQEPVGIALPNDVFFPISMLASLAAGCPYVPLDIDLPVLRNQLIIEQSGLKSIITFSDSYKFEGMAELINLDILSSAECLQNDFNTFPEDIAYIIYTSGSTGIPKGVYQNQRNLLHDVMQYTNSVHLNENDRLTLLYSPSVGGANRDIYGALLNGATLVINNLKLNKLYDLSKFLRKERITIYHSIPNIFRTFLLLKPDKSDLETVRLIYLAGDRIYNTDVDLYKSFFTDNCLLYVGIGATEIATIYRQWFINKNTLINTELIPLGYAVEDREMQLLDSDHKQVVDDKAGEITVYSKFISLGYWNDSIQTEKSFTNCAGDSAIRIYKTGDLGRINRDGLLEFIGRKDSQVKINGYRVELNEIEGLLMNYPSITHCSVVLYTTEKHNAIFAFYVSTIELLEIVVKSWLKERLPDYMIPQRCIQVDEIPLLHNFKNDNKSLRVLAENYIGNVPETEKQPEDSLFTILRGTWSRFLDKESFDRNIKWKYAGGDSVNAVNFLVQLEADLGTTLPTDWIDGEMSPNGIYNYLKTLDLTRKINEKKIIYFFPSLSGMEENTRLFLNKLSALVSVTIINYPKFSNTPLKDRNLNYITAFIEKQIPNYGGPNTGFISTCSGGSIMHHFITSKQTQHYSFIGIIEGRAQYKAPPLYKGFFKRVKLFLKRENIINDMIFALYTRSDYCKKIIHYMERKKYYSFKNRSTLLSIYQNLCLSYFDGEAVYFNCEQSSINPVSAQWELYYKKIRLISLTGHHQDMLNEYNAKIVIDKIAEVLTLMKVE